MINLFHPHCNGYLMPIRGIEFAVFSEPLEADIEARVNGEYLWGGQFALPRGRLNDLALFCPPGQDVLLPIVSDHP
jgi:hypothetical protein